MGFWDGVNKLGENIGGVLFPNERRTQMPSSFQSMPQRQGPGSPMSGNPMMPMPAMPVPGTSAGGGGFDRGTLAMMLMQALGTGVSAWMMADQQKKDREFRQRQYDESADVREEGRRRLLQPEVETPEKPNDFFNEGQTLGAGVQAPPPVGPSSQRDEELKKILRARLGGR